MECKFLCRAAVPTPLPRRGNAAFIGVSAEFHLAEDDDAPAARDNINLATSATLAVRHYTGPGQAKMDHRQRLGTRPRRSDCRRSPILFRLYV